MLIWGPSKHSSTPPLPPFFKGWLTLPKIPRKGGMEKLLMDRGILKRRGFCRKGEDAVRLGIFSSWVVANVTTVTSNYILAKVLLFPLNVGVSPCFHCTVLVPVYRVYTSCFHNTVVRSCYRLHTFVCMMQVLRIVSVWTCGFNSFLKCVISQELMRECTHTV